MKITELENKDLQVAKVEMACDKCIKDKKGIGIAYPLMNSSHFYIISGASGSGKTNLLVNLLKSNRKTKDKMNKLSYRKMFNKIIFVSPSAHTIDDKIIERIPEDQKFTELNDEVFDMVEDITEDGVDNDEHTLLILDDVSSQLRTPKENERMLTQIVKNRRHKNLSIWIVGHKITDLAPSLRSNANMIFLFKPKTMKEITAIQEEYMLMSKKQGDEVMAAVFKKGEKHRHDFMLIDTSLRKGNEFLFFRNYNQLVFEEEDKNENKE